MSTAALRALLHRMADELADEIGLLVSDAKTKAKPPRRKRVARGPVIVAPTPMPMTPEQKEYVDRYVRRVFGR